MERWPQNQSTGCKPTSCKGVMTDTRGTELQLGGLELVLS